MKKFNMLAVLVLMLFLVSTHAQAKWWIFGQSQDEISIPYLYINNISYDEGGDEITLYKQYLDEGNIVIKGKGSLKQGSIGSVQISTDGKESWQKAELSKDGAFVYKFKPETGKKYELYVKVLNTSGKANDFEETKKFVTVSEQDMRAAVIEALNKLTEAYMAENPAAFMELVSEDFAGDFTILDRAIRKDFTNFDNIDLRFTLTSMATGAKGGVVVIITYNRFLFGAKSGQSYRDRGMTEFSFSLEEGGLKLKSMKFPLIFGLSDAGNVATGVIQGPDDMVIVIDGTGNITLKPLSQALNQLDGEGDGGGGGGNQSGIPAPTNLRVVGGMKHHFIELEFDSVLSMDDLIDYETIIEEAYSPNGPWTEALRKPGDTYAQFTTDAIAQEATILYYRARLDKAGEVSAPSNVVAWDNN
jgi:hypothetical protein